MASDKSHKKPRKANGHGGRRAGAGRKTPESKALRADFNAATRETLAAWLPDLLRNLKKLADGGYERVEETFEADEGIAISLSNPGQSPPKPDLVCVKRVRSIAEPDRAANEYLVNQLLGKPRQAVEHSGPDGLAIPVSIVVAIDKVYGETSSEPA